MIAPIPAAAPAVAGNSHGVRTMFVDFQAQPRGSINKHRPDPISPTPWA